MGGLKVACKNISVGFLQACRLEHRLLSFLGMKTIFTSNVQIKMLIVKTMSGTAFKIYSVIPGKGQLISECLLGVIDFSKNQQKI